ncbi:meiotic recombination protein REC8 homolog [Anarrhichthys ocellatus]|uniref:meiotic recombination protein REC8 homolog n=1 Tax=Anarrhichthys ocellatus TaxID=433405 RepID=UPI0012EDE668|nr:meiotic recombination protein REC8 homolog [Anarrhichthys ocellatus]
MFYYPTVLKRHSGCFSTIWLVATKGIRVRRRDFLQVNVKRTCDDIMDYVLEQVPPPRPGLPRPRFSLYLSSQLQYGVILVYHRQCAIFLEELQTVVGELVKQKTSQKIDMDGHGRPSVDFLDPLSLLEEAEGAPDPLFGVMYMREPIPSPNTLIQMGRENLRETSPEHPEMSPTAAAALESVSPGITASQESITLKETEPVAIPVAEFEGEELVDQHPDTIGFLMAQTNHFPEEEFKMPREEVTLGDQEREMERGGSEEDLEKDRTKEPPGSSTESQPTRISSEDAVLLPQEEPDLSAEKPGPPSDQLTPVSGPVVPSPPSAAEERGSPTLQSEDEPSPKVKTRRKRQLIFFDSQTQIDQEVLQQQIDDPLTETTPAVYLPSPSDRIPSAAELFNTPCTFLPEEVLFLWRRSATITPVSGSDLQAGERGPESSESEKEREREMVEAAEALVPRDVAEPELFDISEPGSLLLEGSDQREVTREISPIYTSEKEGSVVSRSASALQDIPEVEDELPGIAAEESPGLLPDLPEHEAPVVFQSLLPPDGDRRTVSNTFQRLLEFLSARKMRAEQDEPYGDILIFPGTNYGEVPLTL